MNPPTDTNFSQVADLAELYPLLEKIQVQNGWAKKTPVIVPRPNHPFVPHRWPYSQMRAALLAAGRLVGTEWAERRNLIMANPFPGNEYATVPSLVGAYQMVKAGEQANSHRHTPNAMRIVLEAGENTFTVVDGQKIPMMPGDVLITPNWCYHGHANESTDDALWIDVLDAPLTSMLGAMFFEKHTARIENATDVVPESPMRFAFSEYQPKLLRSAPVSPGVRMQTLSSAKQQPTFDHVAISIEHACALTQQPTTANQIYVVLAGKGRSDINGQSFDWEKGDMLAAPSWVTQVHTANEDALIIRVSDEPLMRWLGWYRVSGN
ncbi:cupin domain-containing protein [Pusillimonas sp. DMV24BSW_D]|uniref:cupin domain-containing protein n=1 Tax=Neopusillimonas aestuarii TaxID=2716226 RepID=UPI0014081192|nr:cupin domain-containing protein [Pusillimonas sp. DMV24BSW_D]QIM48071.1 cupin domain-containing protein [Pusillimonas sp. DMV24BSW_D]